MKGFLKLKNFWINLELITYIRKISDEETEICFEDPRSSWRLDISFKELAAKINNYYEQENAEMQKRVDKAETKYQQAKEKYEKALQNRSKAKC